MQANMNHAIVDSVTIGLTRIGEPTELLFSGTILPVAHLLREIIGSMVK